MKYRTFRNLLLSGGAAAVAVLWGTGLYIAGSNRGNRDGVATGATSRSLAGGGVPAGGVNPQPLYTPNSIPATPNSAPGLPAYSSSPAQPQGAQRREEQLVLNFLASHPATTDKVKDAFPNESFKVNFYCDGGAKWTRLKIDLDRDGRDDEKWDLEDGRPAKRRVATRDDEQYDREYRWRNAQWVVKN